MKSLTTLTLVMALLTSNSYAGMTRQQNNLDIGRGEFDATPTAFAAALNLGNGEFCIVSTVGKPHLLPQTLEAAEEDDLNSNKQMQEALNSVMSQYPLCTRGQKARIERLAAKTDEQQVNVPTFNIANPLGLFKPAFFPENTTLLSKRDGSNEKGIDLYIEVNGHIDWLELARNAALGCIVGTAFGTFYTIGVQPSYERVPGHAIAAGLLGAGTGVGVFYFFMGTPLLNASAITMSALGCSTLTENLILKHTDFVEAP